MLNPVLVFERMHQEYPHIYTMINMYKGADGWDRRMLLIRIKTKNPWEHAIYMLHGPVTEYHRSHAMTEYHDRVLHEWCVIPMQGQISPHHALLIYHHGDFFAGRCKHHTQLA